MPSFFEDRIDRRAAVNIAPTWGDYGSLLVNVGVPEAASAVPALVRWGAEATNSQAGNAVADAAKYLQSKLHEYSQGSFDELSPAMQARLTTDILTSKEFWQHPGSSLAAQTVRTIPTMAITGLSMFFTGGGLPALMAAAGSGGAAGVGQWLDQVQTDVDSRSDDELRQLSPMYGQLRQDGLSEATARRQLSKAMTGAKPLAVFAVSAATSAFGPETQLARLVGMQGLGRTTEGGIAKRLGKEVGQGALSEGIEEANQQAFAEQSAVDVGLQPAVNWGNVAQSGIGAAAIGGIMGAPAGIIPAHPRAKANTPPPHTNITADPRPEPENPPAAVVAQNATGPASMPARAGNTQATPGIVPATPPVGSNKTVPGSQARNKRASKKSTPTPSPVEAATEAIGVPATPAPVSPENAPTTLPAAPVASQNAIVMDEAQAAALQPKPPKRKREPRYEGMGGPYRPELTQAQTLPQEVTPPEPMPVPSPPASVAPATPAEGFGAGTIAAPPPMPEGAQPAPGFGAGTIAVPVTPGPEAGVEPPTPGPGPRILPVEAPALTQQITNAQQVKEAAAAKKAARKAKLTGITKDTKRLEKMARDGKIADELVATRPKEFIVPTNGPELDALQLTLKSTLQKAKQQGVQFRQRIGKNIPDSLLWLSEMETISRKIDSPKIKPADLQSDLANFLAKEHDYITTGNAAVFRGERSIEGPVQSGGVANVPDTEVETLQAEDTRSASEKAADQTDEEAQATEQEKEATGKLAAREDIVDVEDVETKAKAAGQRAVKLDAHTQTREVTLKGGQKVEVEGTAAPENSVRVIPPDEMARLKEEALKKYATPPKAPEAKAEPKPTPPKLAEVKEKIETKRTVRKKKVIEAPKPSGKAALAEELAKIEPEPSNAQIEADNAPKAHFSVEGVNIAASVAKGTERQFVLPDGRRTSWLYKYTYGHILGTKAPDGQPVDIFLGPEAYPGNKNVRDLPVVVIDQVDPDTKAPDEPKVMFGFKNVKSAVDAYDDSYPRGEERRGGVTVMSFDEFRTWVESKAPAQGPVDETVLPGEEPQALYETHNRQPILSPEEGLRWFNMTKEQQLADVRARGEGRHIAAQLAATHQGTVRGYLEAITKHMDGSRPHGQIYNAVAQRIIDLAGDTPVYIVSPNEMQTTFGKSETSRGFYNNASNFIVINNELINQPTNFAHVVLHESVHAAFTNATGEHPQIIVKLDKILREAIQRYDKAYPGDRTRYTPQGPAYGLTNVHELLAEALSNPTFQNFLATEKASPALKAQFGMGNSIRSFWDLIVRFIGKTLGITSAHDSLLSAVLHVVPQVETAAIDIAGRPGSDKALLNNLLYSQENLVNEQELRIPGIINERLPEKVRQAKQQNQLNAPWLIKIRSLDQLAQLAKQFGPRFGAAARRVFDLVQTIGVETHRYVQKWIPLAMEMREAQRNAKPEDWVKLTDLMHDEGVARVHSDVDLAHKKNAHLGKDTLHGAYPKAAWIDLHERWKALPPELKALREKVLKFYADRQNDMNLRLVRDILRGAGIDDAALAQRLFDGTETEADKEAIGARLYDHIQDAGELTNLKGPYYPQMRRGDYVARALYKITPPTNALREIPDDNGEVRTWEFAGKDARKQAMAYAAQQATAKSGLHPKVTSVYVDPATGSRYYTDENGKEQRFGPEDGEHRFRVRVQNEYMSLHPTKEEARRVAYQLMNDPTVIKDSVKGVEPRRLEPNNLGTDLLSYHLRQIAATLENKTHGLSARERATVQQTLREMSLRMIGSTRIQTRRLPRMDVLGASRDAPQAMIDYINSAAGYMSRLDHQQALDAAVNDMEKEVGSDQSKAFGQRSIFNEMQKRVNDSRVYNAPTPLMEWGNRALVAGFAARLISPATNMLNMLQPITTTLPLLSARFGPGRAASMMLKVYRDIGTGGILKAGLANTGRALKSGSAAELTSIIQDVMGTLNPQERAFVKRMTDVGSIDEDAGIEIGSLDTAKQGAVGEVDRALDYMSRFGRQMPKAIEAVNRLTTGLAAFRLEMQRSGGNVEEATQFAQETINMTQGIYAKTNAAPIFNHPLGRLTFQFKQFASVIYGMIGHQVGKAYRNAEPGDRAEALKSLAYMVAVQTAVAGALGLPTEPIKWALIGFNLLGLGPTPEEAEGWVREFAADTLGTKLGEIATRGVSRALPFGAAFDLSSRAGYQDLLSFGEPQSTDNPNDLWAYFGQLVGGAPASLAMDWVQGSQKLVDGDYAEGLQKIAPIKVVGDLIKAYRVTSEGKKTGAGFPSMEPYSYGEAAIRTFGFTPAREAETTEMSRLFYSTQKSMSKARDDLMHQWAAAQTGSDRMRLWGQVEKFNYKKTSDERLTRSELDQYAKRHRKEATGRKSGLRVTRREKQLYDALSGVYDTTP